MCVYLSQVWNKWNIGQYVVTLNEATEVVFVTEIRTYMHVQYIHKFSYVDEEFSGRYVGIDTKIKPIILPVFF